MKIFKTTSQFQKDFKRIKKRGYDITKLEEIINTLLSGKKLEMKYRDHELSGEYAGMRECHVENDWLFVYKLEEDEIILVAFRTGTHSDLFR